MNLQTRIARAFAQALIKRPGLFAGILLAVSVAGAIHAQRTLHINTNQLDLISQDLRQVKDIKRVIDMVGGAGHLIIALRGSDEANLKATADALATQLSADKENVRTVTYKVSTEFVREKAALFMKTEDIQTLHDRGMAFLKDRIKRANPFFIEIVETKPVELKIDDIVEKYTKIGKKSILDDYYISDDRQMLTLVVKPMWGDTDLGKTKAFVETLRGRFADWSKANDRKLALVEDYDGVADKDGARVEFGFTGSYKSNLDDSDDMQNSLAPVSIWALVGIALTMIAFFGRRIGSMLFVFSGLALGVCLAFGFAAVAIGELNMITSILGGILMGTGIDFGIFVVYRLREEHTKTGTAAGAVEETIVNAGPASFIAAVGVAASFYSLLLSDFRGFSQFGLLAGTGVFLIAFAMYVWIPACFMLLDRHAPKFALSVLGPATSSATTATSTARIPAPKVMLAITGAMTIGLWALAPRTSFDYDSRALMVEDQPTVRLQDELNRRMQISADPAAVYTPTIEATKALWDAMTPLDREGKHSTIDQIASMYSFVPPPEQQEANAKILAAWKEELSSIDPSVLPPEYAGKWSMAMKYLDAKPYTLEEVPDIYRKLFVNLPTTKPENHGYLTFVYPKVDLWDGKNVIAFSNQVENIAAKDGETYHAAGSSVLMATLAKIVLSDTNVFIVLTLVLLLLIMWLDLKSLGQALIAMLPLIAGTGIMLGSMVLFGMTLNFMNIVIFPIVLGFGVSQGVYLMHRFNEGASPRESITSVGAPVACSTITTLVGWGALVMAAHRGLKTMGLLACVGMTSILIVTFTIVPAILQIIHDRRTAPQGKSDA